MLLEPKTSLRNAKTERELEKVGPSQCTDGEVRAAPRGGAGRDGEPLRALRARAAAEEAPRGGGGPG